MEKIKEVFMSIVTLPESDKIEVGDDVFNRFKSTYTEHKEYLNDKQVLQSYMDDAGRSVAFNRIHQIALGFELDGEIRVNVLNGEESDILREFHSWLTGDWFDKSKLHGYNNKFIYDVIKFRGRVNKIPLELEAPQFLDFNLQPWKQTKSVCLMDEIVSSYRGKVSLINALGAAGLQYKGILPGEDIVTYYQSGKFDEINTSSGNTIFGLVNLKRFLDNLPEIPSYELNVQQVGKVEKQQIGVLDHIISSGTLSNPVLEALTAFAEDSGEPRENILQLAMTALSPNAEYGKVSAEDELQLREALGLVTDYSSIQVVADKGNLGKTEVTTLLKEYKDKSTEEKETIINLVWDFLVEKGKSEQKRSSEAFKFLKEQL